MSRAFEDTPDLGRPDDDEQKSIALDLLLDAWEEAVNQGCSPELVATSAIYAAVADLVDAFGEDHVAELAEALPERIRRGEFSMRDGEPH